MTKLAAIAILACPLALGCGPSHRDKWLAANGGSSDDSCANFDVSTVWPARSDGYCYEADGQASQRLLNYLYANDREVVQVKPLPMQYGSSDLPAIDPHAMQDFTMPPESSLSDYTGFIMPLVHCPPCDNDEWWCAAIKDKCNGRK